MSLSPHHIVPLSHPPDIKPFKTDGCILFGKENTEGEKEQLVWSVDRLYINGLLDGLHYPDQLKLDRPVDRPAFFQ